MVTEILDSWDVRIECPKCKSIEDAMVFLYEGDPWETYFHICKNCGYEIMESEWWEVKDGG